MICLNKVLCFQSTYGRTQATPGSKGVGYPQHNHYGTTTSTTERRGNNNLNELETLLQDLSASQEMNKMNGKYSSRPSSGQGTPQRPSIDNLLDELNTG